MVLNYILVGCRCKLKVEAASSVLVFAVAVSNRIKDLLVINSNKKNNASTNTNFIYSSRVLANNFFLQGLWKRTNRIRRQNSFFLILFFTLFSSDVIELTPSRKPVKREACIHANISGVIVRLWIFLSWLWRGLCKITNVMSRKREDVRLKPYINKYYFGRVCIYLWQNSSSVIFVTIFMSIPLP